MMVCANPTPLRILYLNPYGQSVSGADESLVQAIAHFPQGAVQAAVLVPQWSPYADRLKALGAEVHVVGRWARLRRSWNPLLWLAYLLVFPGNLWKVYQAVRRFRPQLIHTNEAVLLQGGLVARLCGLPSVFHVRQNAMVKPFWVFWGLSRIWNRLADHIFVISKGTAQLFVETGIPLGPTLEVLYNGLDLDAARDLDTRADALRQKYGWDASHRLIGTVGRLHPRKRVETFLQACAGLAQKRQDLRFVVVGGTDGSTLELEYEASLKKEASRLGIAERVLFAGTQSDILAWMRLLQVFVMTSVDEGFGRVLIEAMAAGTFLVASESGAAPEIVGDAGLLAPAGNAYAFADKVEAILADRALQSFLRQRSEERVRQNFDICKHSARILEVYKVLIESAV